MMLRELCRLFQMMLMVSAPIVWLSGCGDDGADGDHRLTPTENPVITDKGQPSAQDPLCESDLWNRAKNDENMRRSPIDLITLRDVPASALDPLQAPAQNPGVEACKQICGGADRYVSASVLLTTGERVAVGTQVAVKDCEIHTGTSPLQAACLETWTWNLNCVVLR